MCVCAALGEDWVCVCTTLGEDWVCVYTTLIWLAVLFSNVKSDLPPVNSSA